MVAMLVVFLFTLPPHMAPVGRLESFLLTGPIGLSGAGATWKAVCLVFVLVCGEVPER